MGTQKHDDAPEPQSPERRSPPTVNEIVEELKSLPLNVGYNRLANELFKTGPLPWDADSQERRWRDSDDARLFALLQQIISLQKEKFMLLALTIVGEDNAYDPLVAMLDALTWDGIPRVGTLLNVYLGAERNAYVSEVERILFCEGIARVYSPGCKADYMPILCGAGGIGKSSFARGLAMRDEYFSDSVINLGDVKLTGEQADEILKFIAITGTNEEVLASLKGYCGRDELFDRGYEELSTVIKYLGGFGVAQENFKVDLTIARGLDYYTGTVYETALLDYPQIGSVCSGGRYDNLAEYYTDRKLPGVGISIGVTRLFYVLGEQGLLNDALNTAPADVLLLPMTEDLSFAVSLATRLRERGLRAQLYTENKKFKAKMNYADKTKIPYVLFLGEDEVASGVVTCKDMVTGEQTKGAPDEIIARIYAAIREKNAQKVIVEK